MNAVPVTVYHWPEMPALPSPGHPILIRVGTGLARHAARLELRTVLRRILAVWNMLSPGPLPLIETARGPVWLGQLIGECLDISLSYAEDTGWIGLMRAGWIGVDVMRIKPILEAEDVTRHYIGNDAWKTIQQSPDPVLAFATAWTALEAGLKCLKLNLHEVAATHSVAPRKYAIQNTVQPDQLMVAVATISRL